MIQKVQRKGRAFTLIELLVVVAIIALLISILIPSLQAAKEAGRKAKCLANMKAIATGMHTYANDDSKTIAFPVQPAFGNSTLGNISGPEYLYVTWWTWGGRDPVVKWPVSGTTTAFIREYNDQSPPVLEPAALGPRHHLYAARHRPLNRTLYPNGISPTGQDRFNLPLYQCPADVGYPLDSATVGEIIDDAPPGARKIPMYDGLGNSYRASFASRGSGRRFLTVGPAGHRLDSIPSAGDTLWFADAVFFNMIGANGATSLSRSTLNFIGWHKKRASDCVAFVDGSARFTEIAKRVEFDQATIQLMEVDPNSSIFLNRGANYRLDTYPIGGALLTNPGGAINPSIWGDPARWPVRGYQNNFSG